MARDSKLRTKASGASGQSALILLLIACLLYNPFFTILSTSQDLSVSHPLSYRATVASSELRRCTIDSPDPLIPELSVVLHAPTPFLPAVELGSTRTNDTAGILSQASCDSIWFRPPPAA